MKDVSSGTKLCQWKKKASENTALEAFITWRKGELTTMEYADDVKLRGYVYELCTWR